MKIFIKILFLFISFNLTYAQSPTCATASAMCTGQGGPYNNTSNTTPGGNQTGYGPITGCGGSGSLGNNGSLGSTPRPAWFYYTIGQTGPIILNLQQFNAANQGIDVDFALWGPFPNNNLANICNSLSGIDIDGIPSNNYTGPCNLVDASYNSTFNETIHIPNAQVGEVYMLLVTNFSGQAGTYTINQTNATAPGAGQVSCNVVCGVNLGPDQLFCSSTITQYTLRANFNQAPTTAGSPTYSWYFYNGTSYVLQTTTTVNNYTTSQEGFWKVRVTRPGCSDVAEDDIELRFDAPPNPNTPNNLLAPVGACQHTFDLTSIQTALTSPVLPSNYVIRYYLNENDCFIGNSNYIQTPTAFQVSTTTTIYVRIENIGNAICADANQFFDLVIQCNPLSCQLDLTSAVATSNQTICLNSAIQNITYSFGGEATSATVTGLPTGLTTNINAGVLTISGTPTQTGTFNYEVTSVGCTTNIIKQGTITINPLPSVSGLTSNTSICAGSDAIFTINGTAGSVVTYTINGGSNQTVTIPTSGQATVTVIAPTSNVVIALSNVSLTNCNVSLTNSATVEVKVVPDVTSISTTTPICSGSNAVFTINGTPNATVTYALNNGTSTTTVLNSSGVGTVTVTNAQNNQQLDVTLIALNGCSRVETLTETIVVNTTPVVSNLTSNTSICAGSDAVFTITGTAGSVVTYTINGGSNQTVTIPTSGQATVTVTAPTSNVTLALSNVSLTNCNVSLTNSATVEVKVVPDVTSISTTTPICSGSNAVFTINGTPNATVTYALNNGTSTTTVLNSSGVGTVTVTNAQNNQQLDVTLIALNGCSRLETLTETIVVNPTPVVSNLISNTPICVGSDAVFTITGTAGSVVTYTINDGSNQTVTIPTSGQATVTITAPSANVVIALSNVSLNSCFTSLSNTTTVDVRPVPSVTSLTSNTSICSGSNAVFTINGSANATVTYSVNNGTSITTTLNGSGVGTITLSNSTANVSVTLSQINNGACTTSLTNSANVTVLALPNVTALTSNSPICSGSNAIFTITGTANATVSYSLNGGTSTNVTLNATGTGIIPVSNATSNQSIQLTNVFDGTCNRSLTNSSSVVVNPVPNTPTITPQSDTFCIGEELIFNVSGGANEIVSYTVNNGANQTLTLNAAGTGIISITNPTTALIEINLVNITNGLCSKLLTLSSDAEVVSCDIPKGVSPNGDGLNDTWDLRGYNVKKVEIFNRYGTKVYSKTNYIDEWHGQSDNSNELPDGTYYYVVEFNDSPVKTGWVYLNREQ
jgi:gliding motility-associated-like protein